GADAETMLPPSSGTDSKALELPRAILQNGRGSHIAAIPAVFLLVFCAGAIMLWNGPFRKTTKAAGSPVGSLPARLDGSGDVRILAGHLGGDYTDRLGRV